MADIENGRCHAERAPLDSPPLVQNGKIILQAHHIGWIVCSALTLISMGVSFWLVDKHLRNYTNKYEQRYIVRILFMVPLYAVVSTASYFWWNHATPLLLIRDCYESTVLTAFFYLLLLYISPDVNEQKEVFRKNGLSRQNDKERRRRGEPLQKWVMPLGFVRKKPEDGLYFLQLMKWGVLQYCVVRPGTTLAAVILDYVGLYCEDSWSLGWGHIYITLVVSVSVSIAMYCLLQVYMVVKVELAPHSPLLKLFAIKAVVFLTFWQATGLSLLTLFGLVKDTPYMTANNINIGIGALLETFEMALFACLHIKAFSYKPYVTDDAPTPRLRSLRHAMSFKETGRELWHGWVYMLRKSRGYEVDTQARREAALENVFGRSRFAISRDANGSSPGKPNASEKEKDVSVSVHVEKEVRVGDERQWLGVGDDYVYGLGYQARRQKEPSEGLESQIEKELARRGYARRGSESGIYSPIVDAEAAPVPGHQRVTSWWRRIYDRFSQTSADADLDRAASYHHRKPRASSRRQSREVLGEVGAARLLGDVQEDDYNDPPPPSAIRTYRETKSKRKQAPKRKAPPSMQPPLLSASFADLPSPLSSPEIRDGSRMTIPQSPPIRPAPDLGSPGQLPPLLLAASAQSVNADSFLERAFAGSLEHGSSAEAMSAGPSSSQSHQTQVALGPVPAVSTRTKALPQTPLVVNPSIPHASSPLVPASSPPPPALPVRSPLRTQTFSPERMPDTQDPFASPRSPPPVASPERNVPSTWMGDEPRGRRSSHRRDSAQYLPEAQVRSPTQYSSPFSSPTQPQLSPTSPPRLHRNSVAYSRGTRRNSGPPSQSQPHYTPMNRFIPTRDRIVLPAPLAPASSGPPGNPATPSQQTFSPPRYTPPGLASSPSSTYRRSTAPYSPPSTHTAR